MSLHVERVEVYREGEPDYGGPWRSYRALEIDYGEEEPRPIEKDMAESLEWAKLYFTKLVSEFSDYRGEFIDFRDKSLELNQEILDEVKELRTDLKTIPDERLAKVEKDIVEIKTKLGLI